MDDSVRAQPREDLSEQSLYACLHRASRGLRVLDIMSQDLVTVSSTDGIQHAAQVMYQNHLWCLPIVDNEAFQGVLTQEAILREIARSDPSSPVVTVAERMQRDVQGITPDVSVCDASWFMEETQVKWLPVLAGERLVGVVTQSDVIRALISPLMLVEVSAIMRGDVVAVDAGTRLSDAARIMVNENISCLVVMHGGKPAGILTPTDMIEKAVAANGDSRELLAVDAMSYPIVSIPPSERLVTATRIMDRNRVRRLVVMEGEHVCGIITQTDILRALQEALLREEVESSDEPAAS